MGFYLTDENSNSRKDTKVPTEYATECLAIPNVMLRANEGIVLFFLAFYKKHFS